MTYNELAQVLGTKNPDTGQLYQISDLNVMKMSDLGTGALEDGVFVRGDWIEERGQPGHQQAVPEGELRGGSTAGTTPRTAPPDRAEQRADAR